jgi:hypothetical protein
LDEAYLYRDHSRAEIHRWARELRLFRFVRAYGGHNNDGDQLLVALTEPAEGLPVYTYEQNGRFLVRMSDGYDVTESVVQAAKNVEKALDPRRVIDPPQNDDHCVCPHFYPEIWVNPS